MALVHYGLFLWRRFKHVGAFLCNGCRDRNPFLEELFMSISRFPHCAVRSFANASEAGRVQTRRRRTRQTAQQISLESLEPRQMLSVNPASSGWTATSSANDLSSMVVLAPQNTVGILATVPSAPTSVVAVSGDAQLAVTWVAPASTGGSAITEYLVKYSSNSGSTWTRFFPSSGLPITALSCTVTGLTNGTPYVIKVIAQNAVGIGPPSAHSAPATPATVPSVPTSVVAVRSDAQLAVTWVAPASTGGSPITNYLVKYSSNSGSTWMRFFPSSGMPITALSCTVTGLTNGTPYVIKAIAQNAVGISPPSAYSASATPLTTALTPSFGATTSTADGFTVQISNYDASYTWAGTATASGSVVVSASGLVMVTGVAASTNSTATITTTQANTVGGSALVTATSRVAMSMVTVGNAGNAADTNTGSLYGAVSYTYRIGAYDVTDSQYMAFLNAVGQTDTYGLYNTNMGTDAQIAQISRSGASGSYSYNVMNGTDNRPITWVSWFDCARFSNWMSNGQPSGAQTSTTTEDGAYNVNGATTGNAVAANATNPNTGLAPKYRIPLENEWYKAAYYKGGSTSAGYWIYATQSNSAPGTTIGSSPNQANYNNAIGHATDVGLLSGSGSFYGTFDQTGNVWQWNDLTGTTGSSRGFRGGNWYSGYSSYVSSSDRNNNDPSYEGGSIGFRLASPA